jgi:hypothetical protein
MPQTRSSRKKAKAQTTDTQDVADSLKSEVQRSPTPVRICTPQEIQANKEHNSRQALCLLPEEVIVRILRLAQTAPDGHNRVKNEPTFYNWSAPQARWTTILLVCLRFWDVAVRTPELWSTIDCEWPETKIEFLLRRAGNASLTIRASVDRNADVLQIVNTHFSKAKGAFLTQKVSEEVKRSSFEDLLNARADKLQCLEYTDGLKSFSVTSIFLGGTATSLGKLTLNHVTILDGVDFPVLRILQLSHPRTDLKLHGLLNFLSRANQLHTLIIARVKFFPDDKSGYIKKPEQSKAHLPLLAVLRIEDGLKTTTALLDILPDPSGEFLIEYSWESFATPPDVRLSVRTQAAHMRVLHRLTKFWTRVSGEEMLPRGVIRLVYTSDGVEETLSFGSPAHFEPERPGIRMFYKTPCNTSSANLSQLATAIKRVEVAQIRRPHMQGIDLERFMATFTNVEKLVIEGASGWNDLADVVKWVEERAQEGRPFRAVDIRRSTIDRESDREKWLKTTGRVEEVTWCIESKGHIHLAGNFAKTTWTRPRRR